MYTYGMYTYGMYTYGMYTYDNFFDQGIFRRMNFLTGETSDQRIFWPTNFPNYEFLTDEFQPTNFFDEFWLFRIFFFT